MRASPALLVAALVLVACAPPPDPVSPSDDPAAWDVDASVDWVPRTGVARTLLATDAPVDDVAVELFEGATFVAHRDAATGAVTVASTADDGETWRDETTVGAAVRARQPRLVVVDDTLWLLFAAEDAPTTMRRTARRALGDWSPLAQVGTAGEAPWTAKERGGVGLLSTTVGDRVHLRTSTGEAAWVHVDEARIDLWAAASQPAFELDVDGGLRAVLRSGLGGGHGSPLCTAPATDLAAWTCVEEIAGLRVVDSHVLRHGDDLYVVAREEGAQQPMLWRLDLFEARLEPLFAVAVGGGIRRTGLHTFLVYGPSEAGVSSVDVVFTAAPR